MAGDGLWRPVHRSPTRPAPACITCAARSRLRLRRSLVLGVPDPEAPQIEDEVDAVAAVLPDSEIFLGAAATAEVLREKGAAQPLHPHRHPRLVPPGQPDVPFHRPGRLAPEPVRPVPAPPAGELVTLSGCGTGLNVVVGGDELIGLMRGLLLRRRAGRAGHPVGRQRPEHRRVHGALLPGRSPQSKQSAGATAGRWQKSGGVTTILTTGRRLYWSESICRRGGVREAGDRNRQEWGPVLRIRRPGNTACRNGRHVRWACAYVFP